jgi:hypothetical protein
LSLQLNREAIPVNLRPAFVVNLVQKRTRASGLNGIFKQISPDGVPSSEHLEKTAEEADGATPEK